MNKDNFLTSGILELYVLGLTTPKQKEEVERYAAVFPEIREKISAMRKAIDKYAGQYAIPQPGSLQPGVLSPIGDIENAAPDARVTGVIVKRLYRYFSGLAAVAFFLLAVVSFFLFQNRKRVQSDYDQLAVEFDSVKAQCEQARAENGNYEKVYAFLQDNRTEAVLLLGTKLAPKSVAIVYWNEPERKSYFEMIDLPSPPPGKQYQLWASLDGEMIDMGLLDANNPKLQVVKFIAKAESFNLTLEPEGGSKYPTVELLMAK